MTPLIRLKPALPQARPETPGLARSLGAGITAASRSGRSETEHGTATLGSSAAALIAPGLSEGQTSDGPAAAQQVPDSLLIAPECSRPPGISART